MEKRIEDFLKKRKDSGALRELTQMSASKNGKIEIGGREYINFSSNDYLSLAAHPDIVSAAKNGLKDAVGSSSSRLMTGSFRLHHLLEKRIADLKNKPAALVFNSGYQANVGIISALFGKGDVIFSDRLNHASIVDGILLSGAKLFRFQHNDPDHLEELLKKERRNFKDALIVTETLFSMDGDKAPLKKFVQLKREHDSLLMVDEAHATGIFGEKGAGKVEEAGVSEDVDIIMGTFSKALGSFGAYAAVSRKIKDYLINTCRSFIYSTALPQSIIAANLAAIDIIEREAFRRDKLLEKAEYFRGRLKEKGVRAGGDSQIVPIIIGDAQETVRISDELKKKSFWTTPVRPPTVPEGGSRLRISLSYGHSREDLDKFVESISEVMGSKNKIETAVHCRPPATGFKYVNRQKEDLAVLIPGWATDGHIFGPLDLGYDYLIPEEMLTEDFHEALYGHLKKSGRKTTLIGWSMGGHLAAHFMARYPDAVERTVLISVKEKYSKSDIDLIKGYLMRNKNAYLTSFYKKCFEGQSFSEKEWFEDNLLDAYLKKTDLDLLISQLDFLQNNPFPIEELRSHENKLVFVHGRNDAIVSCQNASSLARNFTKASFALIDKTGHVPFLHSRFKEIMEDEICIKT